MNKTILITAALLLSGSFAKAQNDVKEPIGKNLMTLKSDLMTPEVLWSMGRIASATASPDGKKVAYQVGYYSVQQNKGHQVICIVDANGRNAKQLTVSTKNETDPTWIDGGKRIAYLSNENGTNQVWCMDADGSNRKQMTNSKDDIEGFKFSPDGKHIIMIKEIPFHESIKENPTDLPKATGRVITDLMYKHWDEYVETIPHPFLAEVSNGKIGDAIDILKGEPYECPLKPFGGIEQLSWSPDSKNIAYTSKKLTGINSATSTDSDIYEYNLETGKTTNLCKPSNYVRPNVIMSESFQKQAVNAKGSVDLNMGYDINPRYSA